MGKNLDINNKIQNYIQDLSKEKVFSMTENIYSKVEDVLKLSTKNNISTNASAMKIALDRIDRNKKK